ncbi:T-protein [bacterium BMS3Bbin14]|nr:T-protein [bacterium BMS3Abin13]GBE51891.1 T-protein [bacterium BMS3Bbin14]HDK43662.1 prephenate dehydrogenase/arogenate dehydrogenase family protein [Desulfobacteraceae bacterium]HDL98869.1 prephenate dehydrogenase/arogenate dehydrogenase family protein [Desulfobacteraceae bacterium]HDO31355.1 prephenate dehydrogenase/arogenate dehydrogenase family protein [Desulfobacteraceae bacterium]
MMTIATLGPEKSHAWQAAVRYAPNATIRTYPHTGALIEAFSSGEAELAIIPIYNTREGENKEYFRLVDQLKSGYWIDNIVLPSYLSLGVFGPFVKHENLRMLVGQPSVFRQCEVYIGNTFPDLAMMCVQDLDQAVYEIKESGLHDRGVIDTEEMLKSHGLYILEREVVPHNRTRYAVLGPELAVETGYDATAFITIPLDDRLGMLVDILGEFTRRGINILDMRSENDIKTQKLQVYIEIEGHVQDEVVAEAIEQIEKRVIGLHKSVRLLGSFPRVDMRTRYIKSFGFIGTGEMSRWFADRLENEGYRVMMAGRTTALRPEEMISQVDVVVICVPISVTAETVRKYGHLLADGKALILLAGESEKTLAAALEATGENVELMLVHNLWGPQAATMKDKNAIVVRTARSGRLCSEFEAFLYKHGADIYHDSAQRHDLLMGIGQKLPTVVAVALAMTLDAHGITSEDIASHCTLTSLYPILAMARVHSQNPRTYAEIMSSRGDSRKIVGDFAKNLQTVMALADEGRIAELRALIDRNCQHLTRDFLQDRMLQAKAVDEVLGRMI